MFKLVGFHKSFERNPEACATTWPTGGSLLSEAHASGLRFHLARSSKRVFEIRTPTIRERPDFEAAPERSRYCNPLTDGRVGYERVLRRYDWDHESSRLISPEFSF